MSSDGRDDDARPAGPVAIGRRDGVGAVERALLANGASVKKGAWAEAFAQHAP